MPNYLIEEKSIVNLIRAVESIQMLDGDIIRFTDGNYSIFTTDKYYDIENVVTVIVESVLWNSPCRGDEDVRDRMFDIMLDVNSVLAAEEKYEKLLKVCGMNR